MRYCLRVDRWKPEKGEGIVLKKTQGPNISFDKISSRNAAEILHSHFAFHRSKVDKTSQVTSTVLQDTK